MLNASLGNLAEFIIALAALREGLHDVVKASVIGSILGNILPVLGLAIMVGGNYHERQRFDRTAAGLGANLLLLSAIGLIVPALFHYSVSGRSGPIEQELSLVIAGVLFAT